MRVLVVGATGILRPAAATLAAEGHRVTGVARDASTLPAGVAGLAADATDAFALASALGDDTWDRAIVYCPTTSAQSLSVLHSAVTGSVVRVRTSDAAAPGSPDPLVEPDVLLLGWESTAQGSRWHTPAEVSAAALDVFETGQSRMLGVVTPWSDRP